MGDSGERNLIAESEFQVVNWRRFGLVFGSNYQHKESPFDDLRMRLGNQLSFSRIAYSTFKQLSVIVCKYAQVKVKANLPFTIV